MTDIPGAAAGSPWSRPETVAGFTRTPPNADLLSYAAAHIGGHGPCLALDLGCGAGRNALPLARQGWRVLGIDTSWPMLHESARRASADPNLWSRVVLAAMDELPVADRSCNLLIAHGIWNLARSGDEFRTAVREAARVARPGAGLFVFTFSRTTLAEGATPLAGETFVFTDFSGQPQCFLTEGQLLSELADAGFAPDANVPLTELNRPDPRALGVQRIPVIHQGAFRRR